MPAHFPSMGRSLWDFSLYGEVGRQRVGRTVGYFALLVLLAALLLATIATLGLRSGIYQHVVPELHKLPVVTIKNGEASANVPQPWVKSFFDDGSQTTMVFIIDTTGQTEGFKPDEQGFLLTRTQLLMRNARNGQQPTIDLKDVDDRVIDATLVKSWIPWTLAICFGLVLVGGFLWYVVAKLFFALVLSLVGLIASATRPRAIGYGRILTIALYAITPAIALDLAHSALSLKIPGWWAIYLAVGSVYTAIAVRRAPDDEPAAPAPPVAPAGPGFPAGSVAPQRPETF